MTMMMATATITSISKGSQHDISCLTLISSFTRRFRLVMGTRPHIGRGQKAMIPQENLLQNKPDMAWSSLNRP